MNEYIKGILKEIC